MYLVFEVFQDTSHPNKENPSGMLRCLVLQWAQISSSRLVLNLHADQSLDLWGGNFLASITGVHLV